MGIWASPEAVIFDVYIPVRHNSPKQSDLSHRRRNHGKFSPQSWVRGAEFFLGYPVGVTKPNP
ncbi:hypothetical protein CULCOIPH002_19800 [Corynebacterium ulcerans]|nr:hypothetical protein CULCOIPH001_17620 [Corynebacterium ulcerans]GJJ37068.1 hypothetical protein CULCOIPH002_19800 [Corynebacterium ulcerans]GJJ39564.1 hypothetical protein CULCOIPH003_21950 [Corynebacterium ulcerans]GJJ41507.1 hypothetical protein CULCOIPH004_19180 [Corynebacterium ulcerans]